MLRGNSEKDLQRNEIIEIQEEAFGLGIAKGAPEIVGPEGGGSSGGADDGWIPPCVACCSGGSSALLEKEIEIKL